ncbi:hypothetical protein HJC99_00990 [Candidatus Saccharibacteria bacterium]|nr:hypothetical protein [Candidatus Saccharibacteria bacterium]
MKQIFLSLGLCSLLSLVGIAGVSALSVGTAAAATNPNCTSNGPDPSLGTDFVTYSIPTAGTYTIWTRMMADVPTDNSYYLQIDCGAPISVGGTNLTAGAWSWVDYKDGNTSTKITATLSAGSHTFNLTGEAPNVIVDRVIFATDPTCVPTSTGDNCAIAATATPTVTPTPAPTATATPTPTASATPTPSGVTGDVNGDSRVNVVDLSLLLGKWNTNYASTDLNRDGTVNVIDLSILLGHWTG